MKAPYISTRKALNRRHFLKGVGSCVSLPLLDAMCPAFRAQAASSAVPRFIAMNASLGFHAEHLFPESTGSDYKLTPYLEKLKDLVLCLLVSMARIYMGEVLEMT